MATTYTLGSWIKARREWLGLTQARLADRSGCATETVRKIESNDRRPGRGLDEGLARGLELEGSAREQFLKVVRGELGLNNLPTVQGDDQPRRGPLPSGTVTFLLTDIESATQLWEAHPQMMATAIRRHNQILHDVVEAEGGVIFKTVGDGVCAAFGSAQRAVFAAIGAQRVLREEHWGTLGRLMVRTALHTDTAEPHEGDYTGLALFRAARLCDSAHGGQILLSRTTADLVRASLVRGIELHDLGSYQLRGQSENEHIFQIITSDLPVDFPPLRTQTPVGNLPGLHKVLIGREREVAEAARLVAQEQVRLVTLTGPGGVGKTHLAKMVAITVRAHFPDGAYLIDLSGTNNHSIVPHTVAQALNIRETEGSALESRLVGYLRTRRVLLLLDNFEHVSAASLYLTKLLEACPRVTVLVTSRVLLRLSFEHELRVAPLVYAESESLMFEGEALVAAVEQAPAARLFVERVQQRQPDFKLTPENAHVVAEICRRLDGLPLAIELAASRMAIFMTPQALLDRLGRRLALLSGGARDLPPRQQTLRTTIDWSYSLLSPAEQCLFRQLGVFIEQWRS